MIRPYFRDATNDHKTQVELKFHSGNGVIDYKNQEALKIQKWALHFISSKDSYYAYKKE